MNEEEKGSISVLEIVKIMLKKWWIIAISAIVCACLVFSYTFLFSNQKYEANCKLYVNNSDISIGSAKVNISSSDITATRNLADSYAIILKSRRTLEKVLLTTQLYNKNGQLAPGSTVYDYDELYKMIKVEAIDSTEILGVYVETENEDNALIIANAILEVFPENVSQIILGSSATIVDYAAVAEPVSKHLAKKAVVGFLIGFILSACAILIDYIFINDTIESSDWIKENIGDDIPLLAVIPDSINPSSKSRKYYRDNYYYSDNTGKDK